MGKSIGIDLGTTNSVVAFKDTVVRIVRNNTNEELTRSCVSIPENGEPLIGTKVYNNFARHSPNAVISVKRLMGSSITDPMVSKMKYDSTFYPFSITKLSGGTNDSVAIVLQGKEYTPEQISAEILKQLKKDASKDGEVTHAVITVPAYFDEKQKTATRVAANLAGLKVQRLLSEPTAAAISYGVDNIQSGESKLVLVYDFGGGTFDLSILLISDGQYLEQATGGDRWLGGDDIDRQFKKYIYSELEKSNKIVDLEIFISKMTNRKQIKLKDEFRKQIDDAKKQLSVNKFAKIEIFDSLENENGDIIDIEVEIKRDSFESLIRPLIDKTIVLIDELLEKSGYPIDTIDNILLVGGSSCIPLVKEMLSDKYGKEKVLASEKPMLAIAEGAAILAHSLNEEFECPNCANVLQPDEHVCSQCSTDVLNITNTSNKIEVVHSTSHKYFIQTVDNSGREKIDECIIDNAAILPLKASKIFKTVVDNQKIVQVSIYADAENGTFNRQTIGFYAIKDNLQKNSELVFDFHMDQDQTLRLQVYPKGNKNKLSEIVLGRGDKDSKCFEELNNCIEIVLSSDSISDNKKSEFMDTIQQLIEEIQNIGNSDPANQKWYEIQEKIKNAKEKAETEEDNSGLNLIFAQILLNSFSQFIDNTDTAAMSHLVNRYENSSSEIVKQEILSDLGDITNNYIILIHVFTLKLAADQAKDASKVNQLHNYFNLAMRSLQDGDISSVISVLDQANNSMGQEKIDWSTKVKKN